jgi:hypothetical protein
VTASPNFRHCEREHKVVEALLSGRWAGAWGEELRAHVAMCPVCSEVATVAQALRYENHLAAEESRQPGSGPPAAGLVWWRAQRAALRAAEEQAAQPITLFVRVAQACGALTVAGTAVWQWPRIASWLWAALGLHRATPTQGPSEWIGRFSQVFANPASGVLVATSAAAALTLVAFAAYVVWREE